MSDERLPVHIDPIRMAETRRMFQGQVALAEMERLRDVLQDTDGEAKVSLEFGSDEEGIRYMRGHLEAEVSLICQRCLEPMRYPIDSDFALAMVHSQSEAEALPTRYEPLLVEEKSLFLRDVIEDELLLTLPIIARHAPQDCSVSLESSESQAEEENSGAEGDNPFALLAGLKTEKPE